MMHTRPPTHPAPAASPITPSPTPLPRPPHFPASDAFPISAKRISQAYSTDDRNSAAPEPNQQPYRYIPPAPPTRCSTRSETPPPQLLDPHNFVPNDEERRIANPTQSAGAIALAVFYPEKYTDM